MCDVIDFVVRRKENVWMSEYCLWDVLGIVLVEGEGVLGVVVVSECEKWKYEKLVSRKNVVVVYVVVMVVVVDGFEGWEICFYVLVVFG